MKLLSLISALALLATDVAADTSWIEGKWEWSRERTIETLSYGSRDLRVSLDQSLPDAGPTWILDSGRMEIVEQGESGDKFNYFIRPIDSESFELIFDWPQKPQHYVIVRKTSFGFCYRHGGDYSKPPMPPGYETCYVPLDA